MTLRVVTRPQLFVDFRFDTLDNARAPEVELLPFHAQKGSDYAGGPFGPESCFLNVRALASAARSTNWRCAAVFGPKL